LERYSKKEVLMQTNDHQIRNYSEVLVSPYGKHGTPDRAKFDEEAYAFYLKQVLSEARRQRKTDAKKTRSTELTPT
jgi:hypothetical protein